MCRRGMKILFRESGTTGLPIFWGQDSGFGGDATRMCLCFETGAGDRMSSEASAELSRQAAKFGKQAFHPLPRCV
jgi:hypothetical protein